MSAVPSRLSRLVAGGAFIACALPAAAQSPDDLGKELEALLNTPVTVASKAAESVNDAPGIITVITRRELEGFAAQNLGQVMNRVVGMATLSPDIFINQSVVVRGQEVTPYNNHILVLLNGRPVRDAISGGLNGTTWNAFPLSAVERVEIIRGPGSVLYGSCAYSGVVNIVTRSQVDEGAGGQVTLSGGSHEGYGQQGLVTLKKGDFRAMMSMAQWREKGAQLTFADYDGKMGTGWFDKTSVGVVAQADYKGASLRLVRTSYDPYSLNGGSETWDPNFRNQQVGTHMDLGYTADVNKMLSLTGNVTYNQTNWYTDNKANPQYTTAKATLVEVMAALKPMDNMNVVLGGGGEKAEWNGQGLLIGGDQTSTFFYLQADYRIANVKLIGGAQYNKIQDLDGNVSPRLGAVVNFTSELGAKVLYSTAFRKGYPLETGFNHPVFRGNSSLKPELVTTTEAQVFYQGKTSQASLTYYQSKFKDIITRKVFPLDNPAPGLPPIYLKYLNAGTWDYKGFELEGRLSLTYNLILVGNASWQTNETQDGVKNATLHPNTMVKVGMLYQDGPFNVGLFNAYFAEPKATTLVRADSKQVNPNPEAYNLLSLKATWKAWDKGTQALKVTLEADNLLDKDVRYPDYPNKAVNSFIPLNSGRTVYAGLAFTF